MSHVVSPVCPKLILLCMSFFLGHLEATAGRRAQAHAQTRLSRKRRKTHAGSFQQMDSQSPRVAGSCTGKRTEAPRACWDYLRRYTTPIQSCEPCTILRQGSNCGVSLPGRRACAPLAAPTRPLPLLAACPSAEGGAPEAQASARRDHSSDAAFPTASSLATPPPLLLVRSWSGILPLSAQWARATVSGVNVHNGDRGKPRPILWAIHPPHPPTHPPIHPPTHPC